MSLTRHRSCSTISEKMDEAIGILILDVLVHGFCYYTGKTVLKVLSLGRLAVEPKRKIKKNEHHTSLRSEYHLSDFWTSTIGVVFWISVAVTVALLLE